MLARMVGSDVPGEVLEEEDDEGTSGPAREDVEKTILEFIRK